MLQIIDFRKATFIDTNLLHYLSFNGNTMKFTLYFLKSSLLLTFATFLNKFFEIAFGVLPEKFV